MGAFVFGSLLFATGSGCSDKSEVSDRRPELQGFPAADVEAVIAAAESSDFGSAEEEIRQLQQWAQGEVACRDVYEVYDRLVRTGELQDAPDPAEPEKPISGTAATTRDFIEILYGPLRAGDLASFREIMSDDFSGCGDVPVNADGDRSLVIGDAVAG